jgi:hypothetical protein
MSLMASYVLSIACMATGVGCVMRVAGPCPLDNLPCMEARFFEELQRGQCSYSTAA